MKRSGPIATPQWSEVLDEFRRLSLGYFSGGEERPAAAQCSLQPTTVGPGRGLAATLKHFENDWLSKFNGSAGSRYFGFVTGGSTPAALLGDWITSMLDQNAMGSQDSIAPRLESAAIELFRDLVGLPDSFTGSFVSGATMANFVGLTLGRQWIGEQRGIDVARQGLAAVGTITVLSATPHSSIYKSLSMAGMGKDNLRLVPTLPQREAIDIVELEKILAMQSQACIVVANAGTVNTVDFDDLSALIELKKRHHFWLHVDAAFGGFAACTERYKHLVRGMDEADSITIDAHKWLNVPYDSAVQLSRHLALQTRVFQNTASYLPQELSTTNFVHLTPENSRRLRALPAWFTLHAYGREAYGELVEHHCELATELSAWIDESALFLRLAETRLNGVCFTLNMPHGTATDVEIYAYLESLANDGRMFMTPTNYKGQPAIRISLCNWQTTHDDIAIAWQAMQELHPCS